MPASNSCCQATFPRPRPGHGLKFGHWPSGNFCSPLRREQLPRPSGCSLDRSRLAASDSNESGVNVPRSDELDSDQFGLPSVSVPFYRSPAYPLSQAFERFGIPDQHAGRRAAAHGDHDGHWCRQPQRARTSDNQHRNRSDQRVGQSGCGAQIAHATNADRCEDIPRDTKYPATRSASRCIGARLRCASLTNLHNLRQQRFRCRRARPSSRSSRSNSACRR